MIDLLHHFDVFICGALIGLMIGVFYRTYRDVARRPPISDAAAKPVSVDAGSGSVTSITPNTRTALEKAALDHSADKGVHSYVIPIANTNPQLLVALGTRDSLAEILPATGGKS